jgi:hypothetical protein
MAIVLPARKTCAIMPAAAMRAGEPLSAAMTWHQATPNRRWSARTDLTHLDFTTGLAA